ncbi:CynX/NimT family MFS transporter [Peribacillus cavernae]|nr:MFS transporter [Peribacillus cavernae]MDQ0218656.1 CP family cyanate transporter-like MFS transporter [Peribacillus cavernae]
MKKNNNILIVIGIILIAANMRPAITSVGPLIGDIRSDMSLTNGLAGLITTLPLIAFAISSPIIPKLSRQFGNEIILFLGLTTLVFGILIRSASWVVTLFMGTFVIGIAIAIFNVLLPGLIKNKFPHKVGLLTGVYSTIMVLSAAVSSGLISPLNQQFSIGWRGILACQAIMAALAALLWLPQLRGFIKPSHSAGTTPQLGGLLLSPLAWQVTFFMGLQSFIFFVLVAWLPEILIDRGYSVSSAGWLLSFMQFSGLPATFLVPIFSDMLKNQKVIVVVIVLLDIIGLVGLLSGSTKFIVLWIIFIGLSQGASISLALAFLGLRARNAQQAAELSGMSQSFGYILGALGPVSFGYIYDITQAWTIPLLLLIAVCVCLLVAGLGAGRAMYVTLESEG